MGSVDSAAAVVADSPALYMERIERSLAQIERIVYSCETMAKEIKADARQIMELFNEGEDLDIKSHARRRWASESSSHCKCMGETKTRHSSASQTSPEQTVTQHIRNNSAPDNIISYHTQGLETGSYSLTTSSVASTSTTDASQQSLPTLTVQSNVEITTNETRSITPGPILIYNQSKTEVYTDINSNVITVPECIDLSVSENLSSLSASKVNKGHVSQESTGVTDLDDTMSEEEGGLFTSGPCEQIQNHSDNSSPSPDLGHSQNESRKMVASLLAEAIETTLCLAEQRSEKPGLDELCQENISNSRENSVLVEGDDHQSPYVTNDSSDSDDTPRQESTYSFSELLDTVPNNLPSNMSSTNQRIKVFGNQKNRRVSEPEVILSNSIKDGDADTDVLPSDGAEATSDLVEKKPYLRSQSDMTAAKLRDTYQMVVSPRCLVLYVCDCTLSYSIHCFIICFASPHVLII